MAAASSAQQQVTQLLLDWSSGDTAALDKLIPLVQPELHRLAHYYMSREGQGHTLQTTALVNEAYLQLFVSSASGVAGGSDTEGKAAKGSGERGGSRESFKSAVLKNWVAGMAVVRKIFCPAVVGSKLDFRFRR